MGLVSFIQDAGEKLFGSKPAVAAAVAEPGNAQKAAAASGAVSESIKTYLRAQYLPADDVTITFHPGDHSVTLAGLVAAGETLSGIASEVYGDASKYTLILEANKPMLSDPDKIYPGQVLRCPPLR